MKPDSAREEFAQVLAEHQQLIQLANELEFQLYGLGDGPTPKRVTECQQAAGALIGLLRRVLFRHDQHILPALERVISTRPALPTSIEGD